jgi:phosphatidate cytidylyltransferase
VILGFSTVSSLVAQNYGLGRRMVSVAGCIIYFPVCLIPAVWLWHAENGAFYATFLYLVIATNDAFGQFTGQLFGHHPLVPRISPAKTVEGATGGLVFAALLGACLSSTVGWSLFHGALMGLVIGLSGLVGDLSESSWKRALGLKDFSSLLGGNGGVLDRFDGLLFATPIFFLLLGFNL